MESRRSGLISEYVAIDTCNRTELYYTTSDMATAQADVQALFGPVKTYAFTDGQVVEHLFKVASGLDSMVLGESDIVRQVKSSYAQAAEDDHIGPVLSQLFQRAIHASKVVRTSTNIDSGITSLARYAVLQMEKSIGKLAGKSAVVLGAGQMAYKLGSYLTDEGVADVTFVDRTLSVAQALAEKHHARAASLEDIDQYIASTPVLFTAVAVKAHIISQQTLAPTMAKRPNRPLHIMDLGVPRNVDPAVADIPGVDLYNVDTLRAHIGEAAKERQEAIEAAKSIIEHESKEFWDWYDAHVAASAGQPRTSSSSF